MPRPSGTCAMPMRARIGGEIATMSSPAKRDRARHRPDDARDRPQRRGLARAVGAEQRDDLAGRDRQVHVAHDGGVVVAGRHALDGEERFAHVDSSLISSWICFTLPLPRYAAMTAGSLRTSSGLPCAMTLPNSST